jgi:spore germination cell wall hydrolase CwlJ-like protein
LLDLFEATPKEIHCLELVVEHETTGQLSNGADKVAMVVINRSNSPEFPNTFCEVVFQKNQFTNIRRTTKASTASKTVVNDVITGKTPMDTRPLYFHNTQVKPSWAHKMKQLYKIGAHIFYQTRK